jgi:sugar phosphate isomerase/epimerase
VTGVTGVTGTREDWRAPDERRMIDAKIGHTALTWGVAADPSRLEAAIRDCARLGYAGTETGGKTFDWWEQERPGRLRALLDAAGLTLAGLYLGGDWTNAATVPALLEAAHRWAAALAEFGGEMLARCWSWSPVCAVRSLPIVWTTSAGWPRR